jgi:hypothetical protein
MLPFAGPGILEGTKAAIAAGGTVEEEIARLIAAGATPDQIRQARSDFLTFSKSHSGVLESDYLAGYRDARSIAPRESFEMAGLGATYRAALRNSGIPSTEADVGNVMRIMDELGLPNMGAREDFLNNFLKSQQLFGSQIQTETALAAYRNAKQSIYDWSPEFRNKYFPTLLQSSGQQGGTEMMTALNNYIGGHMQAGEFKALIDAGFARPEDVQYIHNKPVLKKGAHLFEPDVFKSNIVQWAWDFHDRFMKGAGSTEGGFEDLIAKMPRNMSGLIAFLVHNRARLQRDAGQLDLPIGFAAAGDTSLGGNPAAALAALRDSIAQLGATVTSPAVAAAGPGLQALAHGVQMVAAAYGDWAAKNPDAAKGAGAGAVAAGVGTGGWLTWKLFSGLGRLFGFGGGAGAGGAAGAGVAEAAAGGSLLGPVGVAAGVVGAVLADVLTNPKDTEAIKAWFHGSGSGGQLDPSIMEQARRAQTERMMDPEAAHGRALMGMSRGSGSVSVSGQATVDQTFHIDISLEPGLRAALGALTGMNFAVPLSADTGVMDTDAAPSRGIGHM